MLDSCVTSNSFTIFCYIDSADCTVCSMQWLDYWSFYEDDLRKMNTGLSLIVSNSDEKTVIEALDNLRITYPVIFDKFSIIKQNNIILLKQNSVFVVNKKKEVVWLGLPNKSEKTWALFQKTLHHLSKTN